MSAQSILKEIAERGGELRLDGPDLVLKGRGGTPAELAAKIKANKGELVALLKSAASLPPEVVKYPTISASDRSAQLAFWRNMPPARPGYYVDDRGIEWPDHLGPGAVN